MKKIIILTLFLFFAFPALAEERIKDYTVDLAINKDSSVNVVEKITYDFGADERHGIFREIPYKYDARGGTYKLRIDDVKVLDEDGSELKFETSKQSGNLVIKVGDSSLFVSGQKIYTFSYTVKRAINFFDTNDELYWNAVGVNWPVIIDQTRVNIALPEAIDEADLKTECFAGSMGENKRCISTRYKYVDGNKVNAVVMINDRLQVNRGVTVVVGLPKNTITKPGIISRIVDFARDNYIVLLPVLVFIVMYLLWRKKGKDPKGGQTIIAQYSPPGALSPSEVGIIIDERADKSDISADIIYLATLDFLKIKRVSSGKLIKHVDYELIKIKEVDLSLPRHCQDLFNALFGNRETVKMTELKNTFYKDLNKITKAVYQSTVDKGYFKNSPQKIRNRYIVFGIIFVLSAWFIGPIFGAIGIISVFISAIIIMAFGFFMPARTEKGVLAREHILGLKDYLNVAEKDRINFHNAPEKSPRHFEALLPFAMALSVEKAWAEQFKDIYNQAPSWYDDPSNTSFNSLLLANRLGRFTKTANASMASQPSSASSGRSGFSGGGSGGGFGGGGGGSW